MVKNHWGIYVDSEVPTTGVFSMNSLEWIGDDIHAGIDPDSDEYMENCRQEFLREKGIYPDSDNYEEIMEDEDSEVWEGFSEDFAWDGYEQSSALIGFRLDEKSGKYEVDPNAEYSAIASLGQMGSNNLQVLASKWGIKCALCSPCYPGQGDADSPGEYLCYSVPPEVVGDMDEELKGRIFRL